MNNSANKELNLNKWKDFLQPLKCLIKNTKVPRKVLKNFKSDCLATQVAFKLAQDSADRGDTVNTVVWQPEDQVPSKVRRKNNIQDEHKDDLRRLTTDRRQNDSPECIVIDDDDDEVASEGKEKITTNTSIFAAYDDVELGTKETNRDVLVDNISSVTEVNYDEDKANSDKDVIVIQLDAAECAPSGDYEALSEHTITELTPSVNEAAIPKLNVITSKTTIKPEHDLCDLSSEEPSTTQEPTVTIAAKQVKNELITHSASELAFKSHIEPGAYKIDTKTEPSLVTKLVTEVSAPDSITESSAPDSATDVNPSTGQDSVPVTTGQDSVPVTTGQDSVPVTTSMATTSTAQGQATVAVTLSAPAQANKTVADVSPVVANSSTASLNTNSVHSSYTAPPSALPSTHLVKELPDDEAIYDDTLYSDIAPSVDNNIDTQKVSGHVLAEIRPQEKRVLPEPYASYLLESGKPFTIDIKHTAKKPRLPKVLLSDLKTPGSSWTIYKLAVYVHFDQCVDRINFPKADVERYLFEGIRYEIEKKQSVILADSKETKLWNNRGPSETLLEQFSGSETDARLILDALVVQLCDVFGVKVTTEESVTCTVLPTNKYDYRFYKDGTCIGAMEAKGKMINESSVVQAVMQLLLIQFENQSKGVQPNSMPYFNVVSDGYHYIIIVIQGGKLYFEYDEEELGVLGPRVRVRTADTWYNLKRAVKAIARCFLHSLRSLMINDQEIMNDSDDIIVE